MKIGNLDVSDWLAEWGNNVIIIYNGNDVVARFIIFTLHESKKPYLLSLVVFNESVYNYLSLYEKLYSSNENIWYFNTFKEAKDRADEFLKKLSKLSAFL